jgi:hypothetical protein
VKVLCERCGALAEGRLEARPGGGAALVCGACGEQIALEAEAPASPTRAATPVSASTPTVTDDDAWAVVLAHWDDEEAHRTFLARFPDLEGLAGAGQRYRQALAEKPGDAVALRWRDEILKRATVQGLAQLPRASPPRASPKLVRRAMLAGMIGASALAAAWVAWRLVGLARG